MSRAPTVGRHGRPTGPVAATLLAVGLAIGLVLAALPAQADTHTANGDKSKLDLSGVTLRVAYGVVRDTSTQDIRLASGAFENTPYSIKWVPFTTGTAEAVMAGAVDVYPDALALNVITADAGAKTPWTRATAPLSIIGASVAPPAAGVVIGVHPDSGIKKVADLKGKKVAHAGGTSELYWAIASRDAKLKEGDVEEVHLSVSEARAAFLSGAVDALVGNYRTLLPQTRDGSAVILARSNGAAPEYRVTVVRSGLLDDKAHAAAVADFYERIVQSKQWLVKHPRQAADIYQQAAGGVPEDAAAAIKELPANVLQLDDELAKKLQAQTKLLNELGVTPTNPKVSILFDRRYTEPSGVATG